MRPRFDVLVIDDEPDILEILEAHLSALGCQVRTASSVGAATQLLSERLPEVVFSDIHMPGKTGLQYLAECRDRLPSLPAWVFISADSSPETIEQACILGAVDSLPKPFGSDDIKAVLQRISDRRADPLHEIMDIVQAISGIKLGSEKRLLVETRVLRRARVLGLNSVEEYRAHFSSNREKEVKELVSSITTHTTSFFRESEHFDYLYDKCLARLFSAKRPIRIWSAACSSGEEVYSLAITVLEYMREHGIDESSAPPIEIIGTDIDFNSVKKAEDGIYERESVERLPSDLLDRYFDVGTGELSGLVRIKDHVHRLCRFQQFNLLSPTYPVGKVDFIFIRNVLIYFQTEQIKSIARKLSLHLEAGSHLFLGHSESFNGMDLPFDAVGNAIYSPRVAAKPVTTIASSSGASRIRVLIVDDSPTVRKMLGKVLAGDPAFEIVGEAANPIEAERLRKVCRPDVITLDIHMPEMDGITYLRSLGGQAHPPIVMLSSISYEDAVTGLQCLELGAVEYLEKPSGMNLEAEGERIRATLKVAAGGNRRQPALSSVRGRAPEYQAERGEKSLILIGASTGGTEAIKNVLKEFPENSPPVLIVQHIPPHFSQAFSRRLNELCKLTVTEAVHGDLVAPGHAYVAPGGKQMRLSTGSGSGLRIEITDDAPVNRHRPSVDYLFQSATQFAERYRISAALLTGMGADGAQGLRKLRDAGVHTIAQDEDSCVVFGMPREAIALGAAIEVLPLPSIAYHLFRGLQSRKEAA